MDERKWAGNVEKGRLSNMANVVHTSELFQIEPKSKMQKKTHKSQQCDEQKQTNTETTTEKKENNDPAELHSQTKRLPASRYILTKKKKCAVCSENIKKDKQKELEKVIS